MHEVLLARAAVKRSQGRPRAKYRAAKRSIPRCRSRSDAEKATSPIAYWLVWENLAQSLDLVHVEKFFARNLGGLIRDRQGMPVRLMKAKAER